MRNWRPLWVALTILCCAFGVYAEVSSFLSHETSQGFEAVGTKPEFESAYSKRLSIFEKTRKTKAEQSSIQHQKDVVLSVRGKLKLELEKSGFSFVNYKKGVIDSDMGKLPEFKKLLYEKSEKSDQLLSFLKLQGGEKSKKVLAEVLEKFPVKQRALLNPALSNDQLRALFKKHPVLQHYLHEFPGMADPLHFFQTGLITREEFKKQLLTNMFHNGPHAGFWKFYSEGTIPGLVGKDPKAKNFFLNTAYEGEKTKNGFISPRYPGPLSYEGYVHVVFDRLSQGTKGGVEKIFAEIRKFPGQSDVEKMASLLFDNPPGTLEQLSALYDLAEEDPYLNENERKAIKKLIQDTQSRLNLYIAFVARHFELKIEKNIPVLLLRTNQNDFLIFKSFAKEHTVKDQKSVVQNISDPIQFGDKLSNHVIELLSIEESKNGYPFSNLE
ncbi:MAG: hypothetical protein CME70_03640 [Halobacteriovorax sp.]|nr:hypothetical protein [Halobacteriovorax sp.]|tara:strand:+ start:196397 stop:197716 length:1320 start_codon:yes stop_codon:yes gene_type:complete